MNSAIILREWVDAAEAVLSDEEQLCLYRMVFRYSFGEEVSEELPVPVRALWALIRPALDRDKAKYTAKCERNRQNATRSHSQPLAATRSESQPTTTTNTTPNTNPTTTTNTISNEKVDPERERFEIMGVLFGRGVLNLDSELNRFYNYYDALGWRNNKGGAIVNKRSAAAMWRVECDTAGCAMYYDRWHTAFKDYPGHLFDLWRDFLGVRMEDTTACVMLRKGSTLPAIKDPDFIKCLGKFAGSVGADGLDWILTK